MIERIKSLVKNEEGATMVEYAILVFLISISAITVLLLLGPRINEIFQAVLDAVS